MADSSASSAMAEGLFVIEYVHMLRWASGVSDLNNYLYPVTNRE